MPVTVTLKNVPDEIYERLKAAAKAHHRSINGEMIACLEKVVAPHRLTMDERLARIRRLRDKLPEGKFLASEIAEAIRQGRP